MTDEDLDDGFSQYPATVELFRKTRDDNNAFLQALIDYVNQLAVRLDSITTASGDKGSLFHSDALMPLPPPRAATTVGGRPVQIDLVHPSAFSQVGSYLVSPFRTAARDLQKQLLVPLNKFQSEYMHRMDALLTKLADAMKGMKDSRDHMGDALQTFIIQKQETEQAYDTKSPNLKGAKERFIEVQQALFDAYSEMNDAFATSAKLMESGLTDFELIEGWRSNALRSCLTRMGQWVSRFSDEIEKGGPAFADIAKFIPPDGKIGEVMNTTSLQKPGADDAFALARFDPRATMFLEKSQMFIEEQKRGLKLHKVIKNIVGKGDALSVWVGEVVCELEKVGNDILALNINGSQGKVPLSALTPVP
jgi:hypothetical protein